MFVFFIIIFLLSLYYFMIKGWAGRPEGISFRFWFAYKVHVTRITNYLVSYY